MMDLWAVVPYYTAHLSKALLQQKVNLKVGSITYYLDRSCYDSRGIRLTPGLLDVVGRFRLPTLPRRLFKMAEAILNIGALCIRFALSRPDIIHVQYLAMLRSPLPLDWWFVRFWQGQGVRLLLTVHDILPHDTATKFKELYEEVYSVADAIICHSDHVARRLTDEFGVTPSKISVIPHGPFFYDLPLTSMDDRKASPLAQAGGPLFLWQGIIFPYKGIDLLLNAWQTVEAELPDARLVISGTGSPEILDEIREQVQSLDLKHVQLDLRFISSQELVTLYRAADVVVYPYRAITTSGALATGLALGKAIVASDLPVFRELLKDGENALLVDAEDAAQLASALLRLGRDPDLRHSFAEKIRSLEFGDQTWTAIAHKTITAYEHLFRDRINHDPETSRSTT